MSETLSEVQPWFVYIVRCADNTYYTGATNDLAERLRKHNSGKASKYTKVRLPVTLVYSEQVADKSTALKREYQIKQLTRREKIDLIQRAT